MRHAFYFYDEPWYKIKIHTRNFPLEDLLQFIMDEGKYYHIKHKSDYWIRLDDDEKDLRKVIIWSELNLKDNLEPKYFASDDDFFKYLDDCQEYALKRFAEIPAIRIFRDNYEFLEQQWKDICQRKPKYLIIREHDNGYVDIIEKDELSEQDIAIMNREHKIFQNYLKRRQAYEKAHPEKLYPIWRGPEDSEFESDFALYDPVDEQGVD